MDVLSLKKCLLALCASLIPLATFAAGEDGAPEGDPTDFSVTIGTSFHTGNTDSKSANGAAFLSGSALGSGDYRLEAEGHLSRSDAEGSHGEETTVKNGKLEGKLSSPRLENGAYLYLEGSLFSDDVADVDFRAIEGIGGGFSLLKGKETKFSLEAGCSPMWEKIQGGTEYYTLFRVAQLFSHAFANGASIQQKLEYMPASADKGKYLLNASIELNSPLNKWVHLVLTIKNTFNSEPGDGKEKNETSFLAGIRIKP